MGNVLKLIFLTIDLQGTVVSIQSSKSMVYKGMVNSKYQTPSYSEDYEKWVILCQRQCIEAHSVEFFLHSFFRMGLHSTFVLCTALPLLSGFHYHLTGAL